MGAKAKTHQFFLEAIATAESGPINPVGHNKVFHIHGTTSAGAGSAECDILASNDGIAYATLDTLSLTLGTTRTHDTYANTAAWKYIKANLKTLTGTDAEVSMAMGCE